MTDGFDIHPSYCTCAVCQPDDNGACVACNEGRHEACTDDGTSTVGCECARETHGESGIGVVRR
jgi:hypothetical protein